MAPGIRNLECIFWQAKAMWTGPTLPISWSSIALISSACSCVHATAAGPLTCLPGSSATRGRRSTGSSGGSGGGGKVHRLSAVAPRLLSCTIRRFFLRSTTIWPLQKPQQSHHFCKCRQAAPTGETSFFSFMVRSVLVTNAH